MRNCHAWIIRDEDQVKREIRVSKEAARWRFQSKRADETSWTYHKVPPEAYLISFLEVLDRKYRRRRAAHGDIILAKQMLAELAISKVQAKVAVGLEEGFLNVDQKSA